MKPLDRRSTSFPGFFTLGTRLTDVHFTMLTSDVKNKKQTFLFLKLRNLRSQDQFLLRSLNYSFLELQVADYFSIYFAKDIDRTVTSDN